MDGWGCMGCMVAGGGPRQGHLVGSVAERGMAAGALRGCRRPKHHCWALAGPQLVPLLGTWAIAKLRTHARSQECTGSSPGLAVRRTL